MTMLNKLGDICKELYGDKVQIGLNAEDEFFIMKWEVPGEAMPEDLEQFVLDHAGVVTAKKAKEVKTQRNALLQASDWTQVQDAPLDPDMKTAWTAYRQLLRDVPQQPGFPEDVTWPLEPKAPLKAAGPDAVPEEA